MREAIEDVINTIMPEGPLAEVSKLDGQTIKDRIYEE
jgi:hypothetical protein